MLDYKKYTNDAESKEDQTEAKPVKKSGLMKVVIFAGAGLVLTVVVAFASYFFLVQGESEVAETEISTTETAPADTTAAHTATTPPDEIPDSLLD